MKCRNKTMFKIIKYIILLLLVIALIYFIRIRLKHNAMEITLKNQEKIEDIKQKTNELKNEFTILRKQQGQKPTETSPSEDKQELDKFIEEHSK